MIKLNDYKEWEKDGKQYCRYTWDWHDLTLENGEVVETHHPDVTTCGDEPMGVWLARWNKYTHLKHLTINIESDEGDTVTVVRGIRPCTEEEATFMLMVGPQVKAIMDKNFKTEAQYEENRRVNDRKMFEILGIKHGWLVKADITEGLH